MTASTDIQALEPFFAFRHRALGAIEVGGETLDIIDIVDAENPYISLEVTDAIDDRSDEFAIEIYDPDLRWRSDLYPQHGETFEVEFGWKTGELVYESEVMVFQVDSIDSSLRDSVSLKGVATPPLSGLRTRNDRSWQSITLHELFEFFAGVLGLELVGEASDVEYEELLQESQTDLEFLATEAAKHDHLFKIEGARRLVIFRQADLDAEPPAYTLTPQDFLKGATQYSDNLRDVYGKVRVKCENPDTDESIAYEITATGLPEGECFEIVEQGIDSRDQAIERGVAALRKKNADMVTLSFKTLGSTRYRAGLNFALEGAGRAVDGKFQLKQSKHSHQRGSAWTTRHQSRKIIDLGEIEVEEIQLPPEEDSDAQLDTGDE